MKLTGKALASFRKWYGNTHKHEQTFIHHHWYEIPDSMKWGVYVDWADSVSLEIEVSVYMKTDNETDGWKFSINWNDYAEYHETRPEARTAAIEKLDELFNNQN